MRWEVFSTVSHACIKFVLNQWGCTEWEQNAIKEAIDALEHWHDHVCQPDKVEIIQHFVERSRLL